MPIAAKKPPSMVFQTGRSNSPAEPRPRRSFRLELEAEIFDCASYIPTEEGRLCPATVIDIASPHVVR
ncbi:hypothetical protein [Streptomyces sp. NPDC001914]|uniref:hypothetical protein n=1 Tax=Streptomyces sp. NPDC001914 TaxID=3364623 RepID=UPI003673A24A